MLLNFLIFNLFLHIIIFAWLKVENTSFIYRLTVLAIFFSLITSIYDTSLFTDNLAITLFNDNLRLNQAILAQESFILLVVLILLISYKDFKFKPEFFLILFTNLISITLLLESYNFIIFFISWELFNLSLYTMIIGNGVKKQEALAASMKYFLLLQYCFLIISFSYLIPYYRFFRI